MSHHAKIRAMERGIDIAKIKQTILDPTSKREKFVGRVQVERTIDGRVVIVIYKKEHGKFVIITTYYGN